MVSATQTLTEPEITTTQGVIRIGDPVATRFGTFPIEAFDVRTHHREKFVYAVFTDSKGKRRSTIVGGLR